MDGGARDSVMDDWIDLGRRHGNFPLWQAVAAIAGFDNGSREA